VVAATAEQADKGWSMAQRLGFSAGQAVLEIGYDVDCDASLRDAIEAVTGAPLIDDEEDAVDVVVLWWREDDGDLVDALVDALVSLVGGGTIWLLTPKVGRPGHVDPADIADAAPTAGLAATTTVSVSPDWTGSRLVAPKARR
jgi:hypothetical protein